MSVRLVDGRVERGGAQDLRAAAVLRGLPARALVPRGARHHRADLRHLPGRLPDERGERDGGRLRRGRPGADPDPAADPLLRRVDREPRAPRLHAPRARLPRLRRRGRDGPRRGVDRRARPRAEEERATTSWRSWAAARSIRSTSGSAASTARPRSASCARSSSRSSGRARGSLETVRWTAGFDFPEREIGCELVAVSAPSTYAIEDGSIRSDRGLAIGAAEYDEHFVEEHVERSNALHSRRSDGGTYLCGPLARYTLGSDRLSPLAREAAREAGLGTECRDAFRSIVVRSVELVYACDEALRLIEPTRSPTRPSSRRARRRGRLRRDRGAARAALPPLRASTPTGRSSTRRSSRRPRRTSARSRTTCARSSAGTRTLDDDDLRHVCEQAIRNYDPCISCATHFLDLTVERR